MPTLSIVKTDFGKLGKWAAIVIGALIVLFVILKILLMIKEAIFPTQPPPPTVTYGKLSSAYFPEGIKKDFTYEIDTLSGNLPTFTPSTAVYKMEQKGPDILAVKKASDRVSALGFNSKPLQISDFVYKWRNESPPIQDLILNIKLSEFNLSSSFLNYEKDIQARNFTNKTEPIDTASKFLNTLGLYPEDIDTEKTKVEFANLSNGVISPTTRIVNSNVATVYFFQRAKNEIPIVYPQGNKSTMRLLVSAGELQNKVLDSKFSHQKILDESATYPIKTANQAFEELKKGNGYVAAHNGGDNHVLIKKAYVGLYYEGRIQKYLTPVIVFEGNNDFVAFVPAVTDEWIDK